MRKIFLLLAFLSAPLLAMQRATVPCTIGGQVVVTSGVPSTTKVMQSYPGCTITVYISGSGGTLAQIFSDNSLTPLTNPFNANSQGFGYFYAFNGRYDVKISGGGPPSLGAPVTFGDIVMFDIRDYFPHYVFAYPSNTQQLYIPVTNSVSAPSGPCAATNIVQVIPGGTLYTCQNGTWAQISGGGGGGGSVTSVGLALTGLPWMTVSGSPVTSSGNLQISAISVGIPSQFLASPSVGSGPVQLRSIQPSDLPPIVLSGSGVTGVLGATNGGTGLGSLPSHATIVGSGVLPVSSVPPGVAGTCYISNGVALDPSFQPCPGGSGGTVSSVAFAVSSMPWFSVSGSPITSTGTITLGLSTSPAANLVMATPDGSSGAISLRAIVATDLPNIPVTKLNSGTGASISTFWRGDGVWATPAGSGNVSGPGSSTNGFIPQWNGATGTILSAGLPVSATSLANSVIESDSSGLLAVGYLPNIPVSKLNGGTGASSSTYWRGDGTWAAAGNVSGPGSSTNGFIPQWNGTTGTSLAAGIAVSTSAAASTIVESGVGGTIAVGWLPNIPVTNLNSGTGATSSTFWRGDGTWATPASSGLTLPSTLTWTGPTWSSFTGNQNALAVNVNSYPTNAFFFAGTIPVVTGVTGAVNVPSTAAANTVGIGVTGVATSSGNAGSASTATIGGFFQAVQNSVPSGFQNIFGINSIIQNSAGTGTAAGFGPLNMYGIEIDTNLYPENGGSTSNSNVLGLWITGGSTVHPIPGKTVDAIGIGPLGIFNSPVIQWNNGIDINNGAAATGINIGWQLVATGGGTPPGGAGSMPVLFQSVTGGGVGRQYQMLTDLNGNMVMRPGTSTLQNTVIENASAQPMFGVTQTEVQVLNGSEMALGSKTAATLGVPTLSSTGYIVWCSDCDNGSVPGATCSGSGAGKLAVWRPTGSTWLCY